ncbi:MAG: response regulator transcription factor [Salinigranum sp.]
MSGRTRVLIVDDEKAFVELVAAWLAGGYDVRTALDGETALERLAGVDVALVDRRMPGLSGEDVLAGVEDRGCDCRSALVSAVRPDLNVVDLPIDDYLVKPVDREELLATVDALVARGECSDAVRRELALVSKRTAIEAARGGAELESDPRFRGLCERIDRLRTRRRARSDGPDDEALAALQRRDGGAETDRS